tara:strand:- start:380 stop:577 length:198 start_codon:yes stop_codon:yes gene_type:complete
MDNYKFTYDKSISYEANYSAWRIMNNDERHKYNQRTYSDEEARAVFERQYTKPLLETLRVGKQTV